MGTGVIEKALLSSGVRVGYSLGSLATGAFGTAPGPLLLNVALSDVTLSDVAFHDLVFGALPIGDEA